MTGPTTMQTTHQPNGKATPTGIALIRNGRELIGYFPPAEGVRLFRKLAEREDVSLLFFYEPQSVPTRQANSTSADLALPA